MGQEISPLRRNWYSLEQKKDFLSAFPQSGLSIKKFCRHQGISEAAFHRPLAIGRKNYLFAGSHEAARRSGMLYSLFGTCKMHGIEPYTWLKDVLQRIPTHQVNKVHELLPHRWNKPLSQS